jgi:hypothetical protein
MKTVKVTKKNAERLVNELENQLRERLTPFMQYGVSDEDISEEYARINIFSTDITPYITAIAINTVIEVINQSKISKDSMFYGIDSCDEPNTGREVPCISIIIKIG